MSEATTQAVAEPAVDFDTLKHQFVNAQKAAAQEAKYYAERYEPYAERIKAIQDEFEAANGEFLAVKAEVDLAAQNSEAELRQAVVDHFDRTGEKTIDENLSVRVTRSFKYETKDAVAWAEVYAPVMIVKTVDAKAFEKFADGLDFVEPVEKVTAVLKGLRPEAV